MHNILNHADHFTWWWNTANFWRPQINGLPRYLLARKLSLGMRSRTLLIKSKHEISQPATPSPKWVFSVNTSSDGNLVSSNSDILDSILSNWSFRVHESHCKNTTFSLWNWAVRNLDIHIFCESWKYQIWKQICLFGFALMQNKYLIWLCPEVSRWQGHKSKLSSYNKNNPTVEGYSTIVVRGRISRE